MGNTQAKSAEKGQENEQPLEKMTDEELLAAVEKSTDGFFSARDTIEYIGQYSEPLSRYINKCAKKTSNECSMTKLYSLLDKYNTPYTIEMLGFGRFRVNFIRVPVSTKSLEAQ